MLETFPGQTRTQDGSFREFLASATNRVKPVWIDKLFAAELKQQKHVEREHAKHAESRRAQAAMKDYSSQHHGVRAWQQHSTQRPQHDGRWRLGQAALHLHHTDCNPMQSDKHSSNFCTAFAGWHGSPQSYIVAVAVCS
jgi:hypothetical protein